MNPETSETYILYFPKAPDPKDHSTQDHATHRIVFKVRKRNGAAVCLIQQRHPRIMHWCSMSDIGIPNIPNLPESVRHKLTVSVIHIDVPTAKRLWDAFRKESWVRGD